MLAEDAHPSSDAQCGVQSGYKPCAGRREGSCACEEFLVGDAKTTPTRVFFAKSVGVLEKRGVSISRRAKECVRVRKQRARKWRGMIETRGARENVHC